MVNVRQLTTNTKLLVSSHSEPLGTAQPTVKPSKQLSYYYRHKEQINHKRRINYQLTKPQKLKNFNITKKSNDVNNIINSFVDSPITIVVNGQDRPVLTLFDLLDSALETLTSENSDTGHIVGMKTSFFVLPEIVGYTTFRHGLSFGELELHFKDRVSKRQLKRAVQLLVNLKWLIRTGKNDLAVYYPNPFLSALFDQNPQWLNLAEYARLKVDFFDLLNIPLINAMRSNQRIVKTEVTFHKYKLGSHGLWIRAFFEGFVNITLHSENGRVYQTLLPVNLHASPKLEWKNRKKGQNPYGFPHHTIPLKWLLFDVLEGRQYTKARRTSRWQKQTDLKELEYIHFDNSIKILHYVDTQQYLAFRKPFQYALKKWNTKSCEYVEVSSFAVLERLFYYRFVENKRRKELFEGLGLKFKPIGGRPKKT